MRKLVLLALVLAVGVASAGRFKVEFDEDEFENVPATPLASGKAPLLDDELIDEEWDNAEAAAKAAAGASSSASGSGTDASGSAATQEPEVIIDSTGYPVKPRAGFGWPQQHHFYYEAVILLVIAAYAANFVSGRDANAAIAEAVNREVSPLVARQFATTGLSAEKPSVMIRDSYNLFMIYGSGRINCEQFHGNLRLQPRQDLLSKVYHLISPAQDELTIDVVLDKGTVEPFIWSVVRKRDERALKRANPEVKKFAGVSKSLPHHLDQDSFRVLTDCDTLTPYFLTQSVCQLLTTCEQWFVSMVVTDRCEAHQFPAVLRFVFRCPPAERVVELTPLLDLVFVMIDLLPNLRMPANIRSKLVNARQKADKDKLRAEREEREAAAQERRIQKRREEEEKMTSEQLERRRRKDQERRLRKRMPGVKMVR